MTGEKLVDHIRSYRLVLADKSTAATDGVKTGAVAGIVLAVADTYTLLGELCRPEGIKGDEVIAYVVRWVEERPQKWKLPAVALTLEALREKYACAKPLADSIASKPSPHSVKPPSIAEARKITPGLAHLDDVNFVKAAQELYYPNMTPDELGAKLGVTMNPQPASKKKLGPIDQIRLDRCNEAANRAPTSQGVFAGRQDCAEQFRR